MRPVSERGPLLDWEQSWKVSLKLRALRQEAARPQADIAVAAGITQPMLCHLEQGVCRWRERDAGKAAAALGTDLATLLGDGGA
jgi:hypothetical protein